MPSELSGELAPCTEFADGLDRAHRQTDRSGQQAPCQTGAAGICGLYEDVVDKDVIYIINPNGIKYIKEHFKDLELKIIYVYANEKTREQRVKNRSDYESSYKKRCESEDEEFKEFEENQEWDYIIENSI